MEVYAPAAVFTFCPRYAVEPDANDLIVIKNDVFGVELYAPAAVCEFCPRYDVEPDAKDLMT